jgi:hypothetical protein
LDVVWQTTQRDLAVLRPLIVQLLARIAERTAGCVRSMACMPIAFVIYPYVVLSREVQQ